MKKLIAFSLICCMAFSITACQGKTDTPQVDSLADSPSVSTPKESDELPEDSQMKKETVIQEPEKQSLSEMPVQQSTSAHEMRSFYCTHTDGKKIYTELYTPQNKSDVLPLVILGHGYTSSYRYLKGYAEYLADREIACCIFDFCGGSDYSLSDGSMLDMSVVTQMLDMELVLNTLKEYEDFDPERIYIGGESQGGMVAALNAAELQDQIAGLILLYPALYIPEVMRERFPDRSAIPDHMNMAGATVGRRYADDVYEIDAYKEITKYSGKVLILHGDKDGMVPLSYSQQAEQEYENAKLVILPGGGHGIYNGALLETACEEIEHFVTDETR